LKHLTVINKYTAKHALPNKAGVQFPPGTWRFSLSHACDVLNTTSFLLSSLSLEFTISLYLSCHNYFLFLAGRVGGSMFLVQVKIKMEMGVLACERRPSIIFLGATSIDPSVIQFWHLVFGI